MRIILFLLLFLMPGLGGIQYSNKIQTLYNSLDEKSIAQHLAFYELYPNTKEGKDSLKLAWRLLTGRMPTAEKEISSDTFLFSGVEAVVALVNKQPNAPLPELSQAELSVLEKLGAALPNRALKGYKAQNEADVLSLEPDQIDLARGLFLAQLNDLHKVRCYEAMIDLMALQIRVKLTTNASPAEKIRAINDFIFDEMGFRFPPHSIYAKEIDVYTFLPSVLDRRRGVCLGVSILYICLAQRLELPLEMVTPPGHIYVRYRNGEEEINIETTARGIHIDSEEYLTFNTRALEQRNIKDVIGLAYFNQASVFWSQEKYGEALAAYKNAEKYLKNDLLLQELMGYSCLMAGHEEEGKQLLQKVYNKTSECTVVRDTMAGDFIQGNVGADGIKEIFLPVDENRESIIKKREALEKVVEKYPNFKTGIFSLAVTWIQLHRCREALAVLERYHKLDANDPTAEYYLTLLYAERLDYVKSWTHLHQLEKIVKSRNYTPKALERLHHELAQHFPE